MSNKPEPVAPSAQLSRNFTFGELTRTSHGDLMEANRIEAQAALLLQGTMARHAPRRHERFHFGEIINSRQKSKQREGNWWHGIISQGEKLVWVECLPKSSEWRIGP